MKFDPEGKKDNNNTEKKLIKIQLCNRKKFPPKSPCQIAITASDETHFLV